MKLDAELKETIDMLEMEVYDTDEPNTLASKFADLESRLDNLESRLDTITEVVKPIGIGLEQIWEEKMPVVGGINFRNEVEKI